MNLRRINILLLSALLVSSIVCGDDGVNGYEVSIRDIKSSGKEHVDGSVFVKGFLLVDQGAFLYSSLDPLLKYDLDSAVFLQVGDYRPYEKLSGCFVEVAGTVGTHKTDKSEFRLKEIKDIHRAGPLYLMALDKVSGHEEGIKCELTAIVESMVEGITIGTSKTKAY